jgi:hypothetical protein
MAPSVVQSHEVQNGSQSIAAELKQAAATNFLPVQNAAPPTLSSDYQINEHPIRHRRPIKAVCMGAGYSSLMMGIIHNEKMKDKNIDFFIYERNEDLGRTWLENR